MLRSLAIGTGVIFIQLLLISHARADDCTTAAKDVEIESIDATADSWPNLRNSPGSLRFESNRMLTGAAKQIDSAAPPGAFCPPGCKAVQKPTIKYLTIPKKFRSNYSDESKCKKLLEQTSKTPFVYKDRKFSSIDELAAWFGDFSKGSGTDGADLYKKCDGDCSPQYATAITPQAKGYSADASVVCGLARDKDDNKYKLSLSLHWQCIAVSAN